MSKKRPYKMRERARAQDETRLRIVEAAMHLHEELGPRATTIKAIAERAGVQRLTVYRHFPDQAAVFRACTSHWLDLNPPPNPAEWSTITGGSDKVATALGAFYGYYRRTRAMWAASYRDVAEVPALHEPMAAFADFLAAVSAELSAALDPAEPNTEAVRATIDHALAFSTWDQLDGLGLEDEAMVALLLDWLDGVTGGAR